MGLMVSSEKCLAIRAHARQVPPYCLAQIQFFTQPVGECRGKSPPSARCHRQIGLEQAREFQHWLVIKHNRIQVLHPQISLLQAVMDCLNGKLGIVFLTGETLLLRGGNNFSMANQGRRRIMIKCGDT